MTKVSLHCDRCGVCRYHSMKYLEPDQLPSDTIEKMYSKLVVLMNHLVDELRPVVDRQRRHLPVVAKSPVMVGSAPKSASSDADGASQSDSDVVSDVYEADSDPILLMDLAMCGDMSYYVELLEQSAEFFSVRHLYAGLWASKHERS
jgi:hypothetical protein